jgi:hypothetical protein
MTPLHPCGDRAVGTESAVGLTTPPARAIDSPSIPRTPSCRNVADATQSFRRVTGFDDLCVDMASSVDKTGTPGACSRLWRSVPTRGLVLGFFVRIGRTTSARAGHHSGHHAIAHFRGAAATAGASPLRVSIGGRLGIASSLSSLWPRA